MAQVKIEFDDRLNSAPRQTLLQYHPPGGRHGIDCWKVHTGQGGKHHYDTGGNEFIINKDGSITYID